MNFKRIPLLVHNSQEGHALCSFGGKGISQLGERAEPGVPRGFRVPYPHSPALGVTWALGLLHPRLLLEMTKEVPSENGISQIQPVSHFSWFISLSYPPALHHVHCFKLSYFYILPSFYITKQSSLHFACLNPISLFYFQSQIPYFSFYKFPLNCTVRLFSLLLGYPEALFPLCHHSSSVLWFTVLFLLFPILILDNSCSPVGNIHAAPLWSSELFSQSSSFAPQHINLFSLKNKISEAMNFLLFSFSKGCHQWKLK